MKARGLIATALFVLLPLAAGAEPHPDLTVPPGLEERVQFWVQIFTKHGKNQVVFHHREDPGIVYSVLDLSTLAGEVSGAAFEKRKGEAIDAEIERIQQSPRALAAGQEPRDPFERRIERLFKRYGRWSRSRAYREAAELKQLRYQTGIRERFKEGLERSTRFLYAIEHIFREHNVPVEIAQLPLVESSFDYEAYSSVGAAGIWQFMRGTARLYMRVDSAVDERRDPIVSSRAAADYLTHAYSVLGAWPLAITSYNHGVTGVLRASRETRTKDIAKIIARYDGSSFGFASKNFYVEFLAALEVARSPRLFFPDLSPEPPHYFDEVRLARPVAYREVLRLSGLGEDAFKEYNPALLSPVTRGRAGVPAGCLLKVKAGNGQRVVEAVPGSRLTWSSAELGPREVRIQKRSVKREAAKGRKGNSYVVQKGDTVSGIAKKLGVSQKKLLELNPGAAKRLRPKDVLMLP